MFPGNPSHLDSQDGEYVEVGGLMSYSADDTESFRRAFGFWIGLRDTKT
jgi:hypothetical protein